MVETYDPPRSDSSAMGTAICCGNLFCPLRPAWGGGAFANLPVRRLLSCAVDIIDGASCLLSSKIGEVTGVTP